MMQSNRIDPLPLYRQALDACMPDKLVDASFTIENQIVRSGGESVAVSGRINILAYGKASLLMYQAAREKVRNHGLFGSGLVITHQHDLGIELDPSCEALVYSTHPFITEDSYEAGVAAKKFVESHAEEDILIALISGGGSAMVALPVSGLALQEKIEFISAVMHMGVPEREVNVLKKALSDIKGGKLADSTKDSAIMNLILSDERNHQICAISSGMTVFNAEINPIKVMDHYQLWPQASNKVARLLREHGERRDIGSNPRIINTMVGSRENLITQIQQLAPGYGYQSVQVLDNLHSCTPEQAVEQMLSNYRQIIERAEPGLHLVIGSGEVQVTVDTGRHGKGGRNQHLVALMMLQQIEALDYAFVAVATDGMDYLEGVHGAHFDKSKHLHIQSQRQLVETGVDEKDSYHVHQKFDTLIEGPRTGTNLSDIFLFSFLK